MRHEIAPGDATVGARLLAVVENDSLRADVRSIALEIACEKAGPDLAPQIVAMAAAWAEDLDCTKRDPAEFSKDKRAQTQSGLLDLFVARGVKNIEGSLANQERLLALLERTDSRTWCPSLYARGACLEAIASNPAPIELRRRYALAIVAARRKQTGVPDCLLGLLGRESLPVLRKLVRSSTGADDFQFMAAAALAHFGDQEVLPDLEAARPALRAKGVNIEGYVLDDIWRINAQNPPEKLLETIASEDPRAAGRQVWTVRRAVEVGLKPADIRTALLAYAAKVEPRAYQRPDGTFKKLWPGLSVVKKEALKLGVLKPDDLPEVEVPKEEPTPEF